MMLVIRISQQSLNARRQAGYPVLDQGKQDVGVEQQPLVDGKGRSRKSLGSGSSKSSAI